MRQGLGNQLDGERVRCGGDRVDVRGRDVAVNQGVFDIGRLVTQLLAVRCGLGFFGVHPARRSKQRLGGFGLPGVG
ncbi:MAG: hypothetical protein AAGA42_16220 [Actinomycetota bacterium]